MESILKNYLFIHSSHHAGHKPPYLAVIHRLDQPVSGILVFARTPAAAKNLNQQLQNDQFEKYYQAVVCGSLPDSGTLTDYLVKDGRTNTSKKVPKGTKGAKESRLSYECLKTLEDPALAALPLSLVRIHLFTGRHHQIRVQMADVGLPLYGDRKYNPASKESTLALCAFELTFRHPATGKSMTFSCKPTGEIFGKF